MIYNRISVRWGEVSFSLEERCITLGAALYRMLHPSQIEHLAEMQKDQLVSALTRFISDILVEIRSMF